MVNLDSDLARAHPEWMFDAGHGAGLPSRYQHVLDLGHPDAYAYLLERMSELVGDARHRLHQVGPQPVPARRRAHARRPAGVRDADRAVYRLMAELKAAHPGLEIESCASGGGRIDLGVLEFTDRVWPSDCNDPHERLEIQRWTGLLVPPEMQGTHIGAEESHTTHRTHPLDYRAEKALWGTPGRRGEPARRDRGRAAPRSPVGRVPQASTGHCCTRRRRARRPRRARAAARGRRVGRPLRGALRVQRRRAPARPGRPAGSGCPGSTTSAATACRPSSPGRRPRCRRRAAAVARDGVRLSGRMLRRVGLEAPTLDVDRSVLLRVVARPE